MMNFPNITFSIDPDLYQSSNDHFELLKSRIANLNDKTISITDFKEGDTNLTLQCFVILEKNIDLYKERNRETSFFIILKNLNLSLFTSFSNDQDRFVVEDENDVEQLCHVLNNFSIEAMKSKELLLLKKEKEILRILFGSSTISALKENDGYQEKLKDFEDNFFKEVNIDNIEVILPVLAAKILGINVELQTLSEIDLKDLGQLNFLKVYGDKYFCFGNDEHYKVLSLYLLLKLFYQKYESPELIDEFNDWDEVFSDFPIPIVILGLEGDLLLHNKKFSELKLTTKECLELESNDQLTIQKSIYRVHKLKTRDAFHFTFLPVKSLLGSGEKDNSEELGIVSSSIAHELNNPLAGANAALDVMLLDDLPNDISEKMIEMKKGVLRCKKLVETFLGFSRLSQEDSSLYSERPTDVVEQSIHQAFELTRARLIENNIKLSLEFLTRMKFQGGKSLHVLSMIFYMILNELITQLSHFELISGSSSGKIVVFEVIQDFDSLKIKVKGAPIKIPESFFETKLIGHLFFIESLQVVSCEKSIDIFNIRDVALESQS